VSPSRLRLAMWVCCAVLLEGCASMVDAPQTGSNGAPTPIQSVAVDSSGGPLYRSLLVGVAEPESVQVDYWTAGAPRLRVTAFDSGAGARIFLPRLRPNAAYAVEVRPVGGGVAGSPWDDTVTTDTLPADVTSYAYRAHGAAGFPLAMLEVSGYTFTGWVIVDTTGQVVWYRKACEPQGFTRRANGDFVMLDACNSGGLFEVAPDGHVVDSLPNTYGMSHDVIPTPQNTLLFLGAESRTLGDTTWVGNDIWEWNPEKGSAEKRWDAFDFISPATDRGSASTPGDWLHANSLQIGASGNVIVSFLFLGQVMALSPDFSSIVWRLGGRNGTFAVDSDAETYGQHTAAEISPNHVLVFDNMTYDSLTGTHYSRGLEIALDTVAHVAHKAWEFRPQPDNWQPFVGSDRLLPNGDRLVSFGLASSPVASGPVVAYEVTPAGTVAWELDVAGPAVNYRTTPLTSVGNEVEVP